MEMYAYADEFANSLGYDIVDEFNLKFMKVFCSAVEETKTGLILFGVVTNTFRGDEERLGEPCILHFNMEEQSMDAYYKIIKLLDSSRIPGFFYQDLKTPVRLENRSFHVIVDNNGCELYSEAGCKDYLVRLLIPDYINSFNDDSAYVPF